MLALRDGLERQGYLAYCQTATVDGRKFIRLRVGAFATRAAAESCAKVLKAEKGFEGFVVQADIFIDAFGSAFDIVTTPGGTWQRSAAGTKRLYRFPLGTNTPDYSPARIAPNGEAIAFGHANRIVRIDLPDGAVTILHKSEPEADGFAGLVHWSPDGQYLAYLDRVGWESPTTLWVMQTDGQDNRPLAGDETGTTKIKSFHWHPHARRIFYVAGPTYGTVSVGGDLCCTDLTGRREVLVAANPHGDTEVARDFRIVGDRLHYRLAHFDAARQDHTYSEHTLAITAAAP